MEGKLEMDYFQENNQQYKNTEYIKPTENIWLCGRFMDSSKKYTVRAVKTISMGYKDGKIIEAKHCDLSIQCKNMSCGIKILPKHVLHQMDSLIIENEEVPKQLFFLWKYVRNMMMINRPNGVVEEIDTVHIREAIKHLIDLWETHFVD